MPLRLAVLVLCLAGVVPAVAAPAGPPAAAASIDLPTTAAPVIPRLEPRTDDLVGAPSIYVARADDSLTEIAYRLGVGYVELAAANPGVDPWLPGEGTEIMLPTRHLLPGGTRAGVVINLSEMRLYYFPPEGEPQTFPIGIGSEGRDTPMGITKVVRKRERPTWYPPASVRAEKPWLPDKVPPGEENPMGEYALYLGWPQYAVHGTNKPYGVGRRVSAGCIRMYPGDIERLYPQIKSGTPVTVVDEPIKLGWSDGALYLEIHPTHSQADELEDTGHMTPVRIEGLIERVIEAAGPAAGRLDWAVVEVAARERSGLPVRIMRPAAP